MILTASASTPLLRHGKLFAQDATPERGTGSIYLHPAKGSDTNSGAKDSPLRTLAAAAKRVNESTDSNEVTIVLAEGVYAVGETAVFKPAKGLRTVQTEMVSREGVLDASIHVGSWRTLPGLSACHVGKCRKVVT